MAIARLRPSRKTCASSAATVTRVAGRRPLGGRRGDEPRHPGYGRPVASFDDVVRLASAMPEVTEGTSYGRRTWFVGGTGFVWERPFSKADIRRFGKAEPPAGPIVAVRVEDLSEKEALLQAHPDAFFTIPHFDGYAAILIQLDVVDDDELDEAIVDGWLACAPPQLAEAYLAQQRRAGDGG
jgi:hypothetical protein